MQGEPGVAYPPEPWLLQGNFAVGVFLVPLRVIPEDVLAKLPAGSHPLVLAGRAVVGVAAVRYKPGGVLAYDELLVALPVVHHARLAVTIPQIWVSSPASRAGGRALWGIPKELMTAHRHHTGRRLQALYRSESRAILAETSVLVRRRLPGRWRLPLPTVQRAPDYLIRSSTFIRSSNSVRGSLHLAHTEWTFESALSWLQGHRPVLGAAITQASVVFGARVQR
ncbi:acetoacetate decarboxylase family protein [Arthrobacter sp. N199823]|uniref:acetoacetate decarboxylase family protein n=1 Tax=Arthrobacter sp. N199823 TaxID=2058895 RepID=UPI000CE39D34|nr:acetoacetate decarboxylase family protein [Arthrobacter sp. N199823]